MNLTILHLLSMEIRMNFIRGKSLSIYQQISYDLREEIIINY
jgi:hypothetical protein